jgi:hypothetical protein
MPKRIVLASPKRCILDLTWKASMMWHHIKRCFIPTNGRYEQSDGRDFIVVSLHSGSKFSKKRKPKHFKILEGRPKVLLYTYPRWYICMFTKRTMH